MIKVVALGFWICAVTLAATWAGATFLGGSDETQDGQASDVLLGDLASVDGLKINVPMIVDGGIQGYVMAQLSFTVEKETLEKLAIKPDSFIVDEAFRTIYEGEAFNFKRMKKQDMDMLAGSIKANVNKRFGSQFVHDVLFEDLNYVPLERVRGGQGKNG